MKRKTKHHAVSEVISTLLLLAISVVGAALLSVFVSDFFQSGSLGQMQTSPAKSLQIRSFDTRDNTGLMGIEDLDNYHGQYNNQYFLCASSPICQEPDNIPSNNGTEFIVIQMENKSPVSIYPDKIYVNNIVHEWDENTMSATLDASEDSISGAYPKAGKFSIFPTSGDPDYVQTGREIASGKTVNFLIKLSPDSDDILLDKYFQLRVNLGDLDSKEFVIQGGGAQ